MGQDAVDADDAEALAFQLADDQGKQLVVAAGVVVPAQAGDQLERPAVEPQAGQGRPFDRAGEDDFLRAPPVKQGDDAFHGAEVDPLMGRRADHLGVGDALVGDDENLASAALASGDDIARKRPRAGQHGETREAGRSPMLRHDFASR